MKPWWALALMFMVRSKVVVIVKPVESGDKKIIVNSWLSQHLIGRTKCYYFFAEPLSASSNFIFSFTAQPASGHGWQSGDRIAFLFNGSRLDLPVQTLLAAQGRILPSLLSFAILVKKTVSMSAFSLLGVKNGASGVRKFWNSGYDGCCRFNLS